MFEKIKDKVRARLAVIREKADFLRAVDDEVKPIRRAGYLAQKKKNAFAEGQALAKKELGKAQATENKKSINEFGLEDPYKYINPSKAKPNKSNKEKK